MRVYISVNWEGIVGIVYEHQTNSRHAGEYNRFRRLMRKPSLQSLAHSTSKQTVLVNAASG